MSRFIRAELHNHTNESDGSLSVKELIDYAVSQNFGVMALTDHNTVSGHLKAIREASGRNLEIIPGIELTTMFGHLLALDLGRWVDDTMLDPERPELYLRAVRQAGARLIGLAHPFCIGEPIMVGCRNSMHFRYPEELDYIEIYNCGGGDPLSGNMQALLWWEELVLSGHRIGAVSGIDLHTLPRKEDVFTTYAEVPGSVQASDSAAAAGIGQVPDRGQVLRNGAKEAESVSGAELVMEAIMKQKTFISKGPRLSAKWKDGWLRITLDHDSGYLGWSEKKAKESQLLLQVRQDTGGEWRGKLTDPDLAAVRIGPDVSHLVIRLYKDTYDDANLLAAGIQCHRDEEAEK